MSVNIYKDNELIPIAGNGGGDVPDNVVLFEDETTPEEPLPRDADLLAGREPSYYAKQTDVDKKATIDEVNKNWNEGYNLIPFPYFHDSRTINGITWTINEDGSVTANGTSTAVSIFRLTSTTEDLQTIKEGKRYALSALCDSDDGYVEIYRATPVTRTVNGKNFTDFVYQNNENNTSVELYIWGGVTVNNITFHPLLVEVSEDGTYPKTYQRYAQGNVQLTDKVKQIDSSVNEINQNLTNYIPFPDYTKVIAQGNINTSNNSLSSVDYTEYTAVEDCVLCIHFILIGTSKHGHLVLVNNSVVYGREGDVNAGANCETECVLWLKKGDVAKMKALSNSNISFYRVHGLR